VPRARPVLLTFLLLCALAVLAGCGGGSSTTTASVPASSGDGSPAPTKSEYIARANSVCKAARPQTGALIAQVEGATASAIKAPSAAGVSALVALVGKLHTSASSTVSQLQALKQPAGAQAGIDRFLTPLSRAVTSLGQATTALSAGQAKQALGVLLQLQAAAPQLAAAAQAYGLSECEGVLSAGN
jgi:hypothetical protein